MAGRTGAEKLSLADCRAGFHDLEREEASRAGSSLKRKAPSAATLEASDVKTYEGVHEVNSNANAADINVQGKTAQVFQFKQKQKVRAVLIDGEPWFVAADVCESLEFNGRSRDYIRMLDEDEKGAHILRTLGGDQQVQIVSESGLYSLIFKSRKPEAKAFKKWVTAEVLPAIRKHGRYEDSSNKMTTLANDVIGVSGTNLINGVIGQKIAILPVGVQRQAKHKLHAILHTRFNVPRTELIPAEKLDVACEYIAAYALEGEWLGKEQRPEALFTLDFPRAQDLSLLLHYTDWVMHRWNKSIRAGLKELNPELYNSTWEFFMEAQRAAQRLDKSMPDLVAYFQKSSGGKRPQQIAGSVAA